MTRRELKWCLVYSLALTLATALPYILAFLSEGETWSFTGFVFGVEDGNSYIAKMLSGKQGALLFRSPYSTSAQRGTMAFLPYLLLGRLSDGSHMQLVILFHLFRLACIPLLVMAIYRFAAVFLTSAAWRRWVTVLATVGGGLGWALILIGASDWLGSLPLEFYSPETFGFLSIYGLPHLILARALWLTAGRWYLTGEQGWWAGGALLAAGIVHPPLLLPAVAALGAHQITLIGLNRNRSVWLERLGKLVAPSIPLIAYLGYSVTTDTYLQDWAEQNLILSPHPAHYLIAYGALFVPAIWGARWLLRRQPDTGLFPVGWVVASPALAYAPLALQRRLTDGVWIALLILAALGMERMRIQRFRLALMAALLPSTGLLLGFGIQIASDPGEPAFRGRDETQAYEAIRLQVPSGSTVISSYKTGNALPAWAPVTVVAGHGPETADLATILPEIKALYSDQLSEAQAQDLLRRYAVDYLFWGPHERSLGAFDPATNSCLTPIYGQGDQRVYRVCDG